MAKQCKLEQGSHDWLLFRQNHLGSSDTPVVLGVSPYATRMDLFNQKVHGYRQDVSSSMRRGHDLEPVARAMVEDELGTFLFPEVYESDEYGFMSCSLDGISPDGKTMVEIKCPKRSDHDMALCGKIPDKYVPQLQKQLLVMGLDDMTYFSFDGQKGASVKVYRDESMIRRIVDEEKKFWDSVLSKTPPTALTSDEWVPYALELAEVKKKLAPLEEQEKLLRQKLEEMCADGDLVYENLRFTSYLAKGAVDYGAIPNLREIDLELYRKPAQRRYKFTF